LTVIGWGKTSVDAQASSEFFFSSASIFRKILFE